MTIAGKKLVTKYEEAGYTFHLYTDGSFRVTHPQAGTMDEGQATMGEVHAEDAGTYMDTWLEELRSLMAEYKQHG